MNAMTIIYIFQGEFDGSHSNRMARSLKLIKVKKNMFTRSI